MKTPLALLAASIIAACAAPQASLGGAQSRASIASGGTYYCWKRRLDTEGANLVCNWEASAAEACRSTASLPIAKSAIARGPEGSRRCENGEWLVVLTTR